MSEEHSSVPSGASPARITDDRLRHEAARAFVWVSIIGMAMLLVYVSYSLMIVFGALVFAALLDGFVRLLGRALPIARGWRMAITLLVMVGALYWLVVFAGSQITSEAAALPATVNLQLQNLFAWLRERGLEISTQDLQGLASTLTSGVGTVSRAIGGLFGGLTTIFLIVIIGIYFAIDPKLYERGVAWMVIRTHRAAFLDTLTQQARTMRRLLAGRVLGMVAEGALTWILLAWGGMLFGIDPVPMAALLAILTGVLAFIPNIGALISGALMVLVGFSGGAEMGWYTVAVYFVVQNFDGYVLVPYIAQKTVDLAPALVLSAQLILGVLFGILGLALADPLLAMIKVGLERRAARIDRQDALREGAA